MGLVVLEIVATGVLLLSHFAVIVWNRSVRRVPS